MTSSDHVLRLERDFGLLYDPSTFEYSRLGPAETFLLLASREMPLDAAEALLAQRGSKAAASTAVTRLLWHDLLDEQLRFSGRVVEVEETNGTFGAPLAAHLGLTTSCNFSCNHCYSSSGKKSPNELTLDECRSVIDQLYEMGCMKLVLGGGEPFLRADLPEVLEHAKDVGVHTFVHSNASLISDALLEAINRCPPSGLTVSLDGPDAETNDAVRGPGTFERTIAGMAKLRAEYAHPFAISMTITSRNAHSTAEMVDLAKREQASILFLRPPFPAGRLTESRDLMVSLQTFRDAIDSAHARALDTNVVLNAPLPGGPVLPTDFDGFGCIAAHMVLGITPEGDVTPCLNLPDTFVGGNVRERSLLDIWRQAAPFVDLRGMEPNEECLRCEFYESCRGGCRIRALDANGRIDGKDSWCYLNPSAEVRSVLRVINA